MDTGAEVEVDKLVHELKHNRYKVIFHDGGEGEGPTALWDKCWNGCTLKCRQIAKARAWAHA